MEWRLLPEASDACAARTGAWNMAVDELLMESVAAGSRPVLRLYTWMPACVSLGRNQITAGLFDTQLAKCRGIDIVRRQTGGLAVYHDIEVTYAVAVNAELMNGPRETYREINRALVNGLRRLGVGAAVAEARRGDGAPLATRDWRQPCFRAAAEGEVIAGGRKLVGSAQRRERGTILQHGSILIAGDQSPVLELQRLPNPSSAPRNPNPASEAITLHELLGHRPRIDEIEHAVAAGFEEQCGIRLASESLTSAERRRAGRLSSRYRSEAWTWRR